MGKKNTKFKVGDIIKANANNTLWTSEKNKWIGRVVSIDIPHQHNGWDIEVETLSGMKFPTGNLYVRSSEFELLKRAN